MSTLSCLMILVFEFCTINGYAQELDRSGSSRIRHRKSSLAASHQESMPTASRASDVEKLVLPRVMNSKNKQAASTEMGESDYSAPPQPEKRVGQEFGPSVSTQPRTTQAQAFQSNVSHGSIPRTQLGASRSPKPQTLKAPRTNLTQKPLKVSHPKMPRVKMSGSSRRYAMSTSADERQYSILNNQNSSGFRSASSDSLLALNSPDVDSNMAEKFNQNKLDLKKLSEISFAKPNRFLNGRKFSFKNPDQFLASRPSKFADAGVGAEQDRRISSQLVSSSLNLNRRKKPLQRQDFSNQDSVTLTPEGVVQGKQIPSDSDPLTRGVTDLPIMAAESDDDLIRESEFQTVADVRSPISLNPFFDLEQKDPSGTIETSTPLFRPNLSVRNYSELSGLPFQAHHASWTAHAFQHKPLYFEELNLERYGNEVRFQNLFSGAHFFGSALILPFKVGQRSPSCCVTTLGHRRPGECVPYQIHRNPMTRRGFFYQALTITALSL
ncbi:MAG: hypothetical protein AAF939_07580 [Planctomycetota bacterium]